MRHLTGTLLAVAASTMLTGCLATQSQLKHSSDMQSQQLAQTNAALSSERTERAASAQRARAAARYGAWRCHAAAQ